MEWIIGEQYDCGITDGRIVHPVTDNRSYENRTVYIIPDGYKLGKKSEVLPEDLANEEIIHTGRDSPFFNLEHALSSRWQKPSS